jgi:sugar phosphate permease
MSRPANIAVDNRPSPVRYQVLAVACCLALLTYLNRLGFGVAAAEIKHDLGFNDEQMGYLASSFLLAYGLFQMPGGMLADRIGGRNLLTVLVTGWSLLSGATAFGLWFHAGTGAAFVFLLVLRFAFGVLQAAEFPSLSRVMAEWMPVTERASAMGTIWTFSRLGGAIVPFLFTGMLWLFGTWTTPFWVMAGLGLVWCAGFWPWFRDKPVDKRGVNRAELEFIAAGRSVESQNPARLPIVDLLRSRNVWALSLMYGFVGFAGNFFTNMLPLYLRSQRHVSDWEFSCLSALPLAGGIVSCFVGGVLSDWIVRRWGSRKWGRRLSGAAGLSLAALATLLVPWAGSLWALGFFLTAAFFGNDLNIAPAWAACADVGEHNTGIVSGTMNMVGSFAGAAGTAFAGYFFKRDQAQLVFIVYSLSYCLATLCWLAVDVSRPLVRSAPPIPLSDADPLMTASCVEATR